MEKLEITFATPTYACGPTGVIRPHALMGHFQEAAAVHAEHLGFGREALQRLGGYWILSNFFMEIGHLPRVDESVTIRTWPSGNTKLLARREFEGFGSDNSVLFRATSEWMILDRQTGRPKNLARTALPNLDTGPPLFTQPPARLGPPAGSPPGRQIEIGRSSLDLNGHVNHTEYVRFAFDALGLDAPPEPSRMQATYLAEVFEGDRLVISTNRSEQTCSVMIRREGEKRPSFLLNVTNSST